MRVAFFGTSDRSTPILESLTNTPNIELVLCVTKDDTLVGRHKEKRQTEVKRWAKQNAIDYFTTSNLKKDTQLVVNKLIEKKVGIGVVADFSFIIPNEIINTPKYGLINIHFSLLPKWRGASPVQFAILNGDETTGITYQKVAERLDSGDIIHQIGYKMSGKETAGELYQNLFPIAAENLPRVLKDYKKGVLNPQKQEDELATYTFSPTHENHTVIYKEDAKIDWNKSPEEIERAVRAYNPWPIAWTTLGELRENAGKEPGENKDKRVKIYCADAIDGKLRINEIQLEGKKVTDWNSFVNGYLQ